MNAAGNFYPFGRWMADGAIQMKGQEVEVLGGYCTVEDGELVVSRSAFRAVHPLMLLLVGALVLLTVVEVLTPSQVIDSRVQSDASALVLGFGTLGLLLVDLYLKGLLGGDLRVPVRAVRDVSIETERRLWYFKTRRKLPMVVLTVDREGGTTEHAVRLHADDAEQEGQALVDLLERHGAPVGGAATTAQRQG